MNAAMRPWPFSKATDLWQVGVIDAPIAHCLSTPAPSQLPIHWLPLEGSYRFIADPFGHRAEDGTLTVFAEALDYRSKHGTIHYYQLDRQFQVTAHGIALHGDVHLSYPYIIPHAGEIYMLPEAYRTGKLTLYRAARFPDQWVKATDLLDIPAIDASPIYYNGKWWMFFALPGADHRALNELHCAYADDLMGPWNLHTGNPLRTGLADSRMGGTPFVHESALHLPMQDCSETYGGATTILRVETLTPDRFNATRMHRLTADMFHPSFRDGMHTLSACSNVTLIDVKRICHSPMRRVIDLERRTRRLIGIRA